MHILRTGRVTLLALGSCLFAISAVAQISERTPNGRLGIIVGPSDAPVPLRDSAPGFLEGYGQKVGETTDHSMYMILEEKQVPYFFSYDSWVRVAPIREGTVGDNYWAYWGREKSTNSLNFEPLMGLDARQRYEMASWYLGLSRDQHNSIHPALEQWNSALTADQQEIALPALQSWYLRLDADERDKITEWYADLNRHQSELAALAQPWYSALEEDNRQEIIDWSASLNREQQLGLPALQPWYRELGGTSQEDVVEWYLGFQELQSETLPGLQPWFDELTEPERAEVMEWYTDQNTAQMLPETPTWQFSGMDEDKQDQLADWYGRLRTHQGIVFPARQSWYDELRDTERNELAQWYDTFSYYHSERLPTAQSWYEDLSEADAESVVEWYSRLSEYQNDVLPTRQEWYPSLGDAEREELARWYTTLNGTQTDALQRLGGD